MKYGLEFAGRKRCGRGGWGGVVLGLLSLLTLVVVWRLRTEGWAVGWSERPLMALVTPSVPLVLAVTSLVVCVMIWWAVAAVYRNEQWIEAERQRRTQERTERCWNETTGEELGWLDEERVARGVSLEDLGRIVEALIAETSEARELVQQGRVLAAEGCLHQVIGCLQGLRERCEREVRS